MKKESGPWQLPRRTQWTPLHQRCGCVIDWGWDVNGVPPPLFISWCIEMVMVNCPWHGGASGVPITSPITALISLRDPKMQAVYFAQAAIGDDIALGRQLGRELRTLIERVGEGKLAVLAEIPAGYGKWMRANGFDPLDAWLDQRLTDIVLNRGHIAVAPKLFDLPEQQRLSGPSADADEPAPNPSSSALSA